MPGRKVSDIETPRTRLLLLGHIEPTELKEGTYLQTPCKPEPKALCAFLVFDYLFEHNIITS